MSMILAPAGGEEQLIAAVRCGADAVYLGTSAFNARRSAKNFDETGLPAAVQYCHERGVKLHVTVNTLVLDDELGALEQTADLIAASGADAVILQDMAALRLFIERYPHIRRYASTQTAVHNTDGAKRLADLGFDGIVLARELSLREMEKICAAVSVRKEAFVHGAHCMSLSGACYLSGMLGGRSGNRGLCAQPCRLDWHCGQKDHCLSLKDMSLLDHVREMEAAGVDLMKIEGRMKRPEYVAAAVTALKKALAGEPYDSDSLRAVFSRSGFTDGYLTGKRDGDMFGYRTKEDVTGAEGVLKELGQLYHKEAPRVAVDVRFTADETGSALSVTDGERSVTVSGPVPERALHRALDGESAKASLSKTGGTPYFVRDFSASIAEGRMLPAAALNGMRREALEQLGAQRRAVADYTKGDFSFPPVQKHIAREAPALWGRFAVPEQIVCPEKFEKILLPAEKIGEGELRLYGDRLIAQLPALLFPEDEDAFAEKLTALRDRGLRAVLADNIYGVELGQRLGLAVYGGFGLNVTNSAALAEYEKQGLSGLALSFEPDMKRLRSLGGALPRGLAAYGRLPLMHWRSCPVRAAEGCAHCGGKGELTDRLGKSFPVECGSRKYSVLLNSVPLHLGEKALAGFDWLLLYFTRESRRECETVTEDYIRHRRAEYPRTGGLYYRELL